jgi:RsiW-degrading membrane proteinase PrsW (M82 family)
MEAQRQSTPEAGSAAVAKPRLLRLLALSALVFLLVAMLCAALEITRDETHGAFGVGLALAMLPLPLYLSVVLWADRFEPEPRALLVGVFVWGAGAALVVAYLVNTAGAHIVAEKLGFHAAVIYFHSISAPIVEETLKGGALFALALLARDRIDDPIDGVVYAAVVGLGFAMTENILYYGREALDGGLPEAVDLFVRRGLWSPLMHPLFTAATGLGIAYAAARPGPIRWGAPFAGLAVAMLLHSTWNTAVETGWYDAVYFGLFAPLLAGIGLAVVRTHRREVQTVIEYLPGALGLRATSELIEPLTTPRRRRVLRAAARARAGAKGSHIAAAYERAATELAFLEHRLHRWRAADDPTHETAREALRRRVQARYHDLHELGVVP